MLDLQRMLRDVVAELDREEAAQRRRESTHAETEARAFLARLDPESQEGMWFEAVAEKFPSRIDAAIAYLREVKR